MGQQTVTVDSIIDETFARLTKPVETHSVGRPDITEGRPGDLLIAEVQKFEAEGGFKKIVADRNDKRTAAEQAGLIKSSESLTDFGLKGRGKDSPEWKISDGE